MAAEPFQYAVIRVVPRVERGERVNVGVVLLCRSRAFLGARVALDETRERVLLALAPDLDLDAVRAHLATIARIVEGAPEGGPIAALEPAERFHWLAAPASTLIQPSEVHTGMTGDPAAALDRLFASQVG
jgi:hypothetical protein